MDTIITMTTKGQFTIPSKVRKALGINKKGDSLRLEFDVHKKTVRLTKPTSLHDLQAFVQKHSAPNTALPKDIHGWYEKERIADLRQKGTL